MFATAFSLFCHPFLLSINLIRAFMFKSTSPHTQVQSIWILVYVLSSQTFFKSNYLISINKTWARLHIPLRHHHRVRLLKPFSWVINSQLKFFNDFAFHGEFSLFDWNFLLIFLSVNNKRKVKLKRFSTLRRISFCPEFEKNIHDTRHSKTASSLEALKLIDSPCTRKCVRSSARKNRARELCSFVVANQWKVSHGWENCFELYRATCNCASPKLFVYVFSALQMLAGNFQTSNETDLNLKTEKRNCKINFAQR